MRPIIGACLALTLFTGGTVAQTQPVPPPPPPGPSLDGRPPPADAPRPDGPATSARFRLQVGPIFLGMTCPDDEPLKACADFAMQLLDKAESMQKR